MGGRGMETGTGTGGGALTLHITTSIPTPIKTTPTPTPASAASPRISTFEPALAAEDKEELLTNERAVRPHRRR
jgi:hypothetical protein